jgi:hypothetical protein
MTENWCMISDTANVIQTKYWTLSAIFHGGVFFPQSKKHKLPYLGYLTWGFQLQVFVASNNKERLP